MEMRLYGQHPKEKSHTGGWLFVEVNGQVSWAYTRFRPPKNYKEHPISKEKALEILGDKVPGVSWLIERGKVWAFASEFPTSKALSPKIYRGVGDWDDNTLVAFECSSPKDGHVYIFGTRDWRNPEKEIVITIAHWQLPWDYANLSKLGLGGFYLTHWDTERWEWLLRLVADLTGCKKASGLWYGDGWLLCGVCTREYKKPVIYERSKPNHQQPKPEFKIASGVILRGSAWTFWKCPRCGDERPLLEGW